MAWVWGVEDDRFERREKGGEVVLAQGGDRDLARDDACGGNGDCSSERAGEEGEGGTDEQLVGHRIEKRAELRLQGEREKEWGGWGRGLRRRERKVRGGD